MRKSIIALAVVGSVLSCSLAIDAAGLSEGSEGGTDGAVDETGQDAGDSGTAEVSSDALVDGSVGAGSDANATTFCSGTPLYCDDFENPTDVSSLWPNLGTGSPSSVRLDTTASVSPTHSLLIETGDAVQGEFRSRSRTFVVSQATKQVQFRASFRLETPMENGDNLQLVMFEFSQPPNKHLISIRIASGTSQQLQIVDQWTQDAGALQTTSKGLETIPLNVWRTVDVRITYAKGEVLLLLSGPGVASGSYTQTVSLVSDDLDNIFFRGGATNVNQALKSKKLRFDDVRIDLGF